MGAVFNELAIYENYKGLTPTSYRCFVHQVDNIAMTVHPKTVHTRLALLPLLYIVVDWYILALPKVCMVTAHARFTQCHFSRAFDDIDERIALSTSKWLIIATDNHSKKVSLSCGIYFISCSGDNMMRKNMVFQAFTSQLRYLFSPHLFCMICSKQNLPYLLVILWEVMTRSGYNLHSGRRLFQQVFVDESPYFGFRRSLIIHTLRPRQNSRHFPDNIFKWIFLNENVWISINISMKFVPRGQINNIPTLVQVMAWRRPSDKPLFEPMLVRLPTHICVTRPQWVKAMWVCWSYPVID